MINDFSTFNLPDWFCATAQFKETLFEIWSRRYDDLYDEQGDTQVHESFRLVLNALGSPENPIEHKRYIYMAWTIGLAVYPTVKAWYPDDTSSIAALEAVQAYLEQNIKLDVNLPNKLFPDFPHKGAHTAAGEAYAVLYQMLKVLNQEDAYDCLLWTLESAILEQGIVSQHTEIRKVFNWWITTVTPAAYCLRLPSCLYTLGGVVSCDEPNFSVNHFLTVQGSS
jgi:hypothetical protein